MCHQEKSGVRRVFSLFKELEKTVKLTTHFQFKLTTSFGAK
jgi:hypothetical protein